MVLRIGSGIGLSWIVLVGCSVNAADYKLAVEDCVGASDEDRNGLLDCEDPACSDHPSCQPLCGNGIQESGEVCDDGNGRDGDACENDCTLPRCGNGILDTREACDDGTDNGADTSNCTADCKLIDCGNGAIDRGEECDDGNLDDTDGCPTTCTHARCGDGFVREDAEVCDDGNDDNTDDCPATCQSARCGDGFVREDVEVCDDGDADNTDDCPATCQPARCGDGFELANVEACDDGNHDNGDGCEVNCTEPQRFDPTGDVMLRSDAPTTAFGREPTLMTRRGSATAMSIFMFNIPAIDNARITSAFLNVKAFSHQGENITLRVRGVHEARSEASVTYASQPTFSPVVASTLTDQRNTWWRFNLLPLVQRWPQPGSGGLPLRGHLVLEELSTGEHSVEFHSREAADPASRPFIEIGLGND